MRCVNTCASTDGARRAQNCALYTSVCFVLSVPLFAMCSRLFMLCVRMYAVCRSHLCIVNVREYEVQDTFPLHKSPRSGLVGRILLVEQLFLLAVEQLPLLVVEQLSNPILLSIRASVRSLGEVEVTCILFRLKLLQSSV